MPPLLLLLLLLYMVHLLRLLALLLLLLRDGLLRLELALLRFEEDGRDARGRGLGADEQRPELTDEGRRLLV